VALWHAQGAWIKPARLVRLWLSQPGVSFQPHARVGTITSGPQGWVIRDEAGLACATAPLVVIAAAGMTAHLLQGIQAATPSQTPPATHALDAAKRLAGLREVSGQVSWGLHQPGDDGVEVADLADRVLPQIPVNGSGSLIPAVPTSSGVAWFAGATYQPPGGANSGASVSSQHADNLHRLETLLPSCAALLRPRFAAGQVNAWLGTRCTTADRLPLVGPLHEPAIWISTGMGSRGLSYSVLCAELLAARLGAEPLPVEASLARLLQVAPVPRIHPGFT
jgi:tRNA 5-methylaminomethyl-2-thiouridine biosynthesis bifunctional protein